MRNNTNAQLLPPWKPPMEEPSFPKCTATYYVDTHFGVTWRSRRVKSSAQPRSGGFRKEVAFSKA